MIAAPDHTYVSLTGRIAKLREKSILFVVGEAAPREGWVPLAHVHPDDLHAVADSRASRDIELRIKKWKARELGFVAERDDAAAVKDLFEPQERTP
jgi:hypothetical protein